MQIEGLTSATPILTTGSDNGTNQMWNNPFMMLIWLAFLGGGFGGFGGFGGRGEQTITNDFLFSNLNTKLDSMSMTNNQGFSGLNATMNSGFQAISNGICDSTYALKSSIDACCCESQKLAIEAGYRNEIAIANQTSALLANSDANTRAILDKLCESEANHLRAQVCAANDALTESRISAQIAALPKAPVPAYVVHGCYPQSAV